MKRALSFIIMSFAVRVTFAQEVVPIEEAQKVARKITPSAATIGDLPLAITPDVDKPHALRADRVGIMVVPDKQLTAEKLSAADSKVLPVGQLWIMRASLGISGKPISADKLRTITIEDGSKQRELQLYLLGATKNGAGGLELVVFGKEREPIARVPLIKGTAAGSQSLPVELSARKESEDTGTLTFHLVQQYTADLSVVRPASE